MVYDISWCYTFKIWNNYIQMAIQVSWCGCPGLFPTKRRHLAGIRISIVNLRGPDDSHSFIMRIPIPILIKGEIVVIKGPVNRINYDNSGTLLPYRFSLYISPSCQLISNALLISQNTILTPFSMLRLLTKILDSYFNITGSHNFLTHLSGKCQDHLYGKGEY